MEGTATINNTEMCAGLSDTADGGASSALWVVNPDPNYLILYVLPTSLCGVFFWVQSKDMLLGMNMSIHFYLSL